MSRNADMIYFGNFLELSCLLGEYFQ